MSENVALITRNLRQVQDRIETVAESVGRDPSTIKLVAVTKYVDAIVTRDLVAAGCTSLGESRPQLLWQKAEALADLPIEWHLIGHMQRNKLRKTLPISSLIHSVDTVALLQAIDRLAGELSLAAPVDVLLEVNVSGDTAKHGFRSEEMEAACGAAESLERVNVQGLMCMAGLGSSDAGAGKDFAALRTLKERLETDCRIQLPELSMGMSGDFEVAVKEGSTIVRIGSALLDGVL